MNIVERYQKSFMPNVKYITRDHTVQSRFVHCDRFISNGWSNCFRASFKEPKNLIVRVNGRTLHDDHEFCMMPGKNDEVVINHNAALSEGDEIILEYYTEGRGL